MEERGENGGCGIAGLLLVGFVLLKVAGIISWNWWWVLSPLWIWVLLVVLILIIGLFS